jgi:hypothetical protein
MKIEESLIDQDYQEIMDQEYHNYLRIRKEWKAKLKGLINITGLFKNLDDGMDSWMPIDIVEIYNTDEKRSGYSNYQHVRIKDDKDRLLYMKQDEEEIRGIDHCCVWQTVGYCEDDYSGYLLFPLKDGRYLKISYAC